ncbi:MAG: hypothetical protein NVS3B11_18460 [Collimonas sp.]
MLLVAIGIGGWYWNRQNSIGEESVTRFDDNATGHFLHGRGKEETCGKYNNMSGSLAQAGRQRGIPTDYQVAIGPIGRVAETRDKSSETLVIRNRRLLLQKSGGSAITRTIGDGF